ncbi:MAG: hypothetical protein PHW73_01935, partial [Atribacterota bacterium]|nr:hypothetical protein [Atribacterota bacterium]
MFLLSSCVLVLTPSPCGRLSRPRSVESEEVGFRLPLSAQSIGTYSFPVYRFPIWYHLDTVLRRKSG